MAVERSKTSRLYYIEETPKHRVKLRKVARASVRKKLRSAREKGLFITYAKGSEIVREHPDGKIEVVGTLHSQPVKVEQGKKFILQEGA